MNSLKLLNNIQSLRKIKHKRIRNNSLLTLGTALAYTDGNTATNTVRISVEGHAVYPDEDGNIGLVYKVLGDDSPIIAFQNYVEIPVTPHLLSQY
jgi:hypothetical protein